MSLLFEHVAVPMLESRSFDPLFGCLGVGDDLPPGGAANDLKSRDATSAAFNRESASRDEERRCVAHRGVEDLAAQTRGRRRAAAAPSTFGPNKEESI